MLNLLLILLAIVGLLALVAFVVSRRLSGTDLRAFDAAPPLYRDTDPQSEGLAKVNDYLVENFVKPAQAGANKFGAKTGWEHKRERFDRAGLARTDLVADYRDDAVEMDGLRVPGRWTLLPGHDPDRRILYLHGGAFTVGSDVSHRPITWNLATRTGCAVFAPNYRLMPENTRRDAIADARAAYRWILEHGPDGPGPAEALGVAGDSAGGNLALMLINWARDAGLRPPDAAYALSPSVDSTAASPTFKANLETDLMLQPLLRPLVKVPRPLLLMGMRRSIDMNPSHPDVSPVFANLSDLPPTLVQASRDEMLHGDAVRWVNKARAAGSLAELQSWSHMPHVFQIFDDVLPEAHDALDAAADFLRTHGVVARVRSAS
ncbi:alpha/beta hydrolase fold domain-containing protein [uncultured Algimonas sp.]|uniref:alpha/beta hydrolase n=1 Tax=uncultured Algimonas sp. TaxID=1547920 RepID=UPI00262E7C63|nr:alpha/beta hydrolase fold domain-containing protein [uncultured Algimonas sp.]